MTSTTQITFTNIQDVVNSENPESVRQFIKKHLELGEQDIKGICFGVGRGIHDPTIDISLWEYTSSSGISVFARIESEFKSGVAKKIELVWKNTPST